MKVDFIKGLEKGMDSLHTQGAFLTVKGQEKENTMTISWGSIGFMWQKPVFMALVRKSRYTYELIENADSFTVSIPFGSEMKGALMTCGTKSGRDIDKQEAAGIKFVPAEVVESPVVDGCNMYYECKIVYKQAMDKAALLPDIQSSMYGDDDYHTLYYGEIVASYER